MAKNMEGTVAPGQDTWFDPAVIEKAQALRSAVIGGEDAAWATAGQDVWAQWGDLALQSSPMLAGTLLFAATLAGGLSQAFGPMRHAQKRKPAGDAADDVFERYRQARREAAGA